jgi:hypothetical protein
MTDNSDSHEVVRRVLGGLTALPHRGSGTAQEEAAASFLAATLTEWGFHVETQPFRTPATYSWELLAITILLAIGGLVPVVWMGLAGVYWFWAYFSGAGTPWDAVFRRRPSQNLIARAGEGDRRLVLMAHYDTAKTFFVYHPERVRGFRANFLLNAVLAAGLVPAIIWLPVLGSLIGVYFLAQGLLLIHRELTAPYVNGANDNASGVAVAAALFREIAARPPAGWEVWLLLTGGEEVGAQGARAFLRRFRLPMTTPVLNIDNVGAGTLHYAVAEGMLGLIPFRGPLVDAAAALTGASPIRYSLAYFDTLPFARAGYPCLTLIRLEGGIPPHWHWPTDTLEHVDPDAVTETLAYARSITDKIFQRPSDPNG